MEDHEISASCTTCHTFSTAAFPHPCFKHGKCFSGKGATKSWDPEDCSFCKAMIDRMQFDDEAKKSLRHIFSLISGARTNASRNSIEVDPMGFTAVNTKARTIVLESGYTRKKRRASASPAPLPPASKRDKISPDGLKHRIIRAIEVFPPHILPFAIPAELSIEIPKEGIAHLPNATTLLSIVKALPVDSIESFLVGLITKHPNPTMSRPGSPSTRSSQGAWEADEEPEQGCSTQTAKVRICPTPI